MQCPLTWSECSDAVRFECAAGSGEIAPLGSDVLRVRFAPASALPPPDPYALVPARAAVHWCVDAHGQGLVVGTSALEAVVAADGCVGFFHGADGTPFAVDACVPTTFAWPLDATVIEARPGEVLPAAAGRPLRLRKRLLPADGCYGLGQADGPLDRRHRRIANWNVDISIPGHWRSRGNRYQSHPFVLVARPGFAWGLFLNMPGYSEFDLGAERSDTVTVEVLGTALDYVVCCGPTPAAVLEQFTRVTGRPHLPPRWARGYHQSRWGYRSAAEVEALAGRFREADIPLDAVHLDIDYMHDFRVFTWHPQRFPEPAAMHRRLAARGVRTVAIVDPGVKAEFARGYAVADEGRAREAFIRDAAGNEVVGWSWPDEMRLPDFARPAVRAWWGERMAALLEAGVAGIWNDMNEPAVVDRPYRQAGTGPWPVPLDAPQGEPPTCHAAVHNLYGAQMTAAAWDALRRARPERRPWTLTRSSFSGGQRHGATWTGDNRSRWEDLAASLPQLLSMGLSGQPHVGADIGGFYGNAHGELFARWIALGVLYPFMRAHTAAGNRPNDPWEFGPEVEAVARAAIRLRYRLLPYLCTLAQRAHRSGEPLLRPLFYDFPDHEALFAVDDQAMLGPLLMAAPAMTPRRRRLVTFPPGRWYDFWSGLPARSEVWDTAPGHLPLFVRGGALLTLAPPVPSSATAPDRLIVSVWPGADGAWEHLDDDGESAAADSAVTALRLSRSGDRAALHIAARRGSYRPPPRLLELRLHGMRPPAALLLDGHILSDWDWDAERHYARVTLPDSGAEHRLSATGVSAD